MKTINEFLAHNSNLGTTLYYPGAGLDFDSIDNIIENTTITKVYLGTEAIKTYHILVNIKNIKIDILVLQDHGFGCNWSSHTFGFNKNQKENLLYNLCKASINLPKYILLGQNTAIWPNYKQETKFEAQNDSSHKKALFTLI
jgi:hypothetical protein